MNCSPLWAKGPQAELVLFSIQDFSITRTGETWEDYRNALRGMFKGLVATPPSHDHDPRGTDRGRGWGLDAGYIAHSLPE
jgi:hypothetical protein